MRVLYLSYDGLTDPLGQSQILPYLDGLVKKGHEITVISFEKAEARSPKPEARSRKSVVGSHSSSFILHPSEGENDLKWIPLKYHKDPPVISTLLDIWLLKKKSNQVVRSTKIDIVHCRSYITSLVGLWLKRKYGIRFIFDMRGFWADERVEGGLWRLKNPVYRWIYYYFKKKEREFIEEADIVVSLTENGKKALLEFKDKGLGLKDHEEERRKKIHIISTCVDTDLFNPGNIDVVKQSSIKQTLGIVKDDFVLLYLGSLGTWYMLDEMMEFFLELKRNRKNSKFLLLTRDKEVVSSWLMVCRRSQRSGVREDRMLRNDPVDHFNEGPGCRGGKVEIDESEWKELEESIIITQADREEVPVYVSLCDASIFFINPTFSKKASSATKMGEVMAMGKPVITNPGWGDVEGIIDHGKDGLLVDDFSVETYQKAIAKLDEVTKTPASDIREKAVRLLSLEKGVEAYDRIYETLKSETLKSEI